MPNNTKVDTYIDNAFGDLKVMHFVMAEEDSEAGNLYNL